MTQNFIKLLKLTNLKGKSYLNCTCPFISIGNKKSLSEDSSLFSFIFLISSFLIFSALLEKCSKDLNGGITTFIPSRLLLVI